MIVEPKYKFDKITMPKIKEPLSEQEINVLKLAAIGSAYCKGSLKIRLY